MRVKPAPGRTVRDPVSFRPLPPDGAEVPPTSYWLRRLDEGDVVTCFDVAAPTVIQDKQIPDSSFQLESDEAEQ